LKFYFRFRLWPVSRYRHLILHRLSKFRVNRTISGLAMTLCQFSRWRTSAMMYFLYGSVNHPRREIIDGTSFVIRDWRLISCIVSEILQFLDFGNLAWKCLLTPLLGGFLGRIPPNDVTHRPNPKRTVLGLNHVIWAIKLFDLGVRSRKQGQYRTAQEKVAKWLHFAYLGKIPTEAIYIKNCLVSDVLNAITLRVSSFKMKFSGVTILQGSNFRFSYWYLNGPYTTVQR